MKLIVGLGNPGPEYEFTRHNIGFLVADYLSDILNASPFQKVSNTLESKGRIKSEPIYIIKPQTFMNLSGKSVQFYRSTFKIDPLDWIIIHDELDFDLGTIRLKVGGGTAGHNGLESIVKETNSNKFLRIRVGIGRAKHKNNMRNYVLGDFTKKEETLLEPTIKTTCDAIQCVIREGLNRAQLTFHTN